MAIRNILKNFGDLVTSTTSRQQDSGLNPNKTFMGYPISAIGEDSDYFEIRAFDYLPEGENNKIVELNKDASTNGIKTVDINPISRYSSRQAANEKALFTITLPIPNGISDQNVVTWGEDSLNPLQAAAAGGALGLMTAPRETIEQAVQQVRDTKGMSPDEQEMILTYLGGKAAELAGANVNAAQLVTRATGKIVQSNLELLFKNVNLRQFTFNWDLSPRNIDEAKEVKQIIRTLKRAMSPQDGSPTSDVGTGATSWFIGSPNSFRLAYKRGSQKHPFLNSFKPCALTSIDMNYSGSGMYASYEDGTPVNMTMGLSFKEINPIYAQDYAHNSSGNGVGF